MDMIMCHMIADTEVELHAMANRIGVARRWYQENHYDICLNKKMVAVQLGAIEISQRQCGCMVMKQRKTESLGKPDKAVEWVRNHFNHDFEESENRHGHLLSGM